ncbi:receptor-like serine/threonine-protein kinase ale2 [Quercus suber]|uniref:Receptor-like serine/threonine-protein kinase ale2 n=1 Tax=Quercus suber TaxID=58331 RepID=A0AAW0L9L3_QUESU
MDFLVACDQICIDPLTATPVGSPCGCVFPMKVRLLLDVATFAVFPVMRDLEIEIAEGTYLEQRQVKIMGAIANSQNQERIVVDINLVPLGEKFDNSTAVLTSDRFWHKKVPLNTTLFSNYEVVYIRIPSSPPSGSYIGNGPNGSGRDLPITQIFVGDPPNHSKFCQQEPADKPQNHCHNFFVCIFAPISFHWSCLNLFEVEEG